MNDKEKKEIRRVQISDDIFLENMEFSDTTELYSMIDSQREYVGFWWIDTVRSLVSQEESKQIFTHVVTVVNIHPEYSFVIFYKNELVGFVGLKHYDEINSKAELAFFISQYHQGKGIMIHSVFAVMELAFNELFINKLSLRCPIGNLQSSNIPRKLGFMIEGVEHAGELWNGETVDLEVYGMLREEFIKIRESYKDIFHDWR